MQLGVSGTSSQQNIGHWPIIFMMVWKSCSELCRSWFDLTWIQLCPPLRALSIGPIRPLPAGIPMHACCSWPHSVLKVFRGTPFARDAWCSSYSRFLTFFLGSWMHHLTPSKIQPNISFRADQAPSPSNSFLIEMGSSLLWPVTNGGGNMEWIASSTAPI